MATISNTLFALLSPGDRVVSIEDTYGGTNKLFIEFLPRFGIEVALCRTSDHDGIEKAISAGCKLLYLASPINPTVKILDIPRLAAAAHREGAVVVVDNTLATPINQQPLELAPIFPFTAPRNSWAAMLTCWEGWFAAGPISSRAFVASAKSQVHVWTR